MIMNKKSVFAFCVLLIFVCSCSDNNGTGINQLGTGGNVTFTMQGTGNQTTYDFYFKPSIDVKIDKIIALLPAQNFTDTAANPNTNYVFSKDSSYTWYSYTGVTSAQQWTFRFSGVLVSNNNPFSESADFIVP